MEFKKENIPDIVKTDEKGYEWCARPFLDFERIDIFKSSLVRQTIKILMGCYFIQLVVEKKKKSNLCLRFQIYQYLKKRPLCWTSILVDMCREYNIIVVFWFFLVLKNMFPYFLVCFFFGFVFCFVLCTGGHLNVQLMGR